MVGWEVLREDLRRLYDESPDAVMAGPGPDGERYEKRIRIELDAWAVGIAGALHAKYGELVDLRVGAMTFPAGELWVDVAQGCAGDESGLVQAGADFQR
jgi:hypothetical protein